MSVISTPEAKGHNIKIDELSIESFAKATEGKKIKAYYTHSDSNEVLESIGLWENFEIIEDGEFTKLTADFVALDAWKEHHKDEYDALFELAEKAPEAFGVSAEFTIDKVFYDDNGEEQKYEGQEDKEVFARAVEVDAFSIVAQPAANPTGLFAEKKEDFVALSASIIEMEEQKTNMEMDLKIAKDAVEKLTKALEEKQNELSEKDKELEDKDNQIQSWKLKFSNFVSDSGAYPVEAGSTETPKTFEEQLANCKTWKEKNELIKANMQMLVTTWNQ